MWRCVLKAYTTPDIATANGLNRFFAIELVWERLPILVWLHACRQNCVNHLPGHHFAILIRFVVISKEVQSAMHREAAKLDVQGRVIVQCLLLRLGHADNNVAKKRLGVVRRETENIGCRVLMAKSQV